MTAEALTAAAAIGTFVVITASAIAALIQLHHMSSNNELSALRSAMESWDGDRVQSALYFLRTEFAKKMQDESYRNELDTTGPVDRRSHPELYVCDFWDTLGVFIMHGLLRESAFLEMGADMVAANWETLSPANCNHAAKTRRRALYWIRVPRGSRQTLDCPPPRGLRHAELDPQKAHRPVEDLSCLVSS